MISFPCTTRLSFDFFKSKVSISETTEWHSYGQSESERDNMRIRTMTSEIKVKDIADTDVDYTKETLVASLEFTLVKDLDGNHGGIFNSAGA